METIKEDTLCPMCKEELNDDDGEFFNEMSAVKKCPYCNRKLMYVKQFKRDIGNPYCDYVWDMTYFDTGNLK